MRNTRPVARVLITLARSFTLAFPPSNRFARSCTLAFPPTTYEYDPKDLKIEAPAIK